MHNTYPQTLKVKELGGSVVDGLTLYRGVTGSSLTGGTALCP